MNVEFGMRNHSDIPSGVTPQSEFRVPNLKELPYETP